MFLGRGLRVVAALVGLAGVTRAEVVDRIVATVDGEPITVHELEQYAKDRQADRLPREKLLEALITDKLLEKEIAALNITARPEEVDRYVAEVRARNGVDDDRFARALASQGLTMETYRARIKSEIEKSQLVNREIRAHVNVSPEEIRRYYEAHLDDYALRERARVRDIFFAVERDADEASIARTRAKAEEVRELAVKGRDFGALARQFSEGPGADKGGELGTFSRGEMEHALDEAAFELKPGQVSDVIQTLAGFHVLRTDEDIAAGHKSLDDVRDDIRDSLYNDALEERFQTWVSRDLRERHHVEVID